MRICDKCGSADSLTENVGVVIVTPSHDRLNRFPFQVLEPAFDELSDAERLPPLDLCPPCLESLREKVREYMAHNV